MKKTDLTLDVEDYKLNIRAAGIIIHNGKVLVHRSTIWRDYKYRFYKRLYACNTIWIYMFCKFYDINYKFYDFIRGQIIYYFKELTN